MTTATSTLIMTDVALNNEIVTDNALIKLQSCDGQVFEVDLATSQQMGLIKNMLEALSPTVGDQIEVIPVPTVRGTILTKVLSWCNHYRDEEVREQTNRDKSWRQSYTVNEWDAEFLREMKKDEVFELMVAANYLHVQNLLDAACKTVAILIEDKSPKSIRKMFGIKADLSKSEQTQIEAENKLLVMD